MTDRCWSVVGTITSYFARKEDIVFEWFGRLRAEFATALAADEQLAVDSTSRLRGAFRVLAALYEEDPATGHAMVRAWQRAGGPLLADGSEAPKLVADSVRAGQRADDIPGGVDPDRVALILFDAYLGVLYRWVLDETDQVALGEQLTATRDLILPAITHTSSVHRRTGQNRRTRDARRCEGARLTVSVAQPVRVDEACCLVNRHVTLRGAPGAVPPR